MSRVRVLNALAVEYASLASRAGMYPIKAYKSNGEQQQSQAANKEIFLRHRPTEGKRVINQTSCLCPRRLANPEIALIAIMMKWRQ